MAGADNVVFNVRERPLSTDQNNLESMLARTIADLDKYMFAQKLTQASTGAPPLSFLRDVVLGGLICTPNGTSVDVSAGALLQDSTTISPVPTSLDSSYRIAINRSVTTVATPSPGSLFYYLLEAQMSAVTTSTESRDILDPGTGNFVPTLVPKQVERRIIFQVRIGTVAGPPIPLADWVPIAVVRRAAGGPALVQSDIVDVRPLWSEITREDPYFIGASATKRTMWTTSPTGDNATGTNLVQFDFEAYLQGRRMYAKTSAAVDLTLAAFLETGLVYASDTLYFIYLARARSAYLPTGMYPSVAHRGILVVSATGPSQGSDTNSAVITTPAPFGSQTIPIGDAVCVGAILRSSFGDGFMGMVTTDAGRCHIGFNSGSPYTAGAVMSNATPTRDYNFATNGAGATATIPGNARLAHFSLQVVRDTANTNAGSVGVGTQNAQANFENYATINMQFNHVSHYEFSVPVALTRALRFIASGLGGGGATATVVPQLTGWSY